MFFDRWIKDEKGSALAMVLIIMLVLGILGTAFMNLSVAEIDLYSEVRISFRLIILHDLVHKQWLSIWLRVTTKMQRI